MITLVVHMYFHLQCKVEWGELKHNTEGHLQSGTPKNENENVKTEPSHEISIKKLCFVYCFVEAGNLLCSPSLPILQYFDCGYTSVYN